MEIIYLLLHCLSPDFCIKMGSDESHYIPIANCSKGNVGETSERRSGAHMGFSSRTDTILN